MVTAEGIVEYLRENQFRLGQVQGFGYGDDGLLMTVRDCWLRTDQVVWQKQSKQENQEADHEEMCRQIEVYQFRLALAALEGE